MGAGELGILSALILIGAVFFTVLLRPIARRRSARATRHRDRSAGDDRRRRRWPAERSWKPNYPPNSVAVLPFTNISSDSEQEFFVDGLSEELMNQLAQVRALRVTARTSSFAFKGTTETVEKIAERLNVAHVLEGSVRKAGDQLVITAQLIDTTNGFHLWSKSYNRELRDIFAIQQEIAREVVNALQVTLGLDEDRRIAGGTENLDAYALYLASTARDRGSVVAAAAALELVDQALELDPNFALAWAHKARLTLFLRLDPQRNAAELQAAAETAARRAVELEPDSALAHAVMASAASVRGDWLASRRQIPRSFCARRTGGTWRRYGLLQLVVGHVYDARERLLLQRQRDPLNDSAVAFLAAAEDSLGNTQGALAEYERGAPLFGPWFAGYYNMRLDAGRNPRCGLWVKTRRAVGFSFADPAFAPIVANWDDASGGTGSGPERLRLDRRGRHAALASPCSTTDRSACGPIR